MSEQRNRQAQFTGLTLFMQSELIELNYENWTVMVRLLYQILDGEVGLMEGCSQLWKQADDYNLLSLSCFDWFVQLDLEFDKFLAGAAAAELPARRNTFEESRREEIITKLKLLMLQLGEPVFTLQYAAEAFLKGDWSAQQAIMAMRCPIVDLGLDGDEPYDEIYDMADDFHLIPSGNDRQLWHPELLKRKEDENLANCVDYYLQVKIACQYILAHPISRR